MVGGLEDGLSCGLISPPNRHGWAVFHLILLLGARSLGRPGDLNSAVLTVFTGEGRQGGGRKWFLPRLPVDEISWHNPSHCTNGNELCAHNSVRKVAYHRGSKALRHSQSGAKSTDKHTGWILARAISGSNEDSMG